MKRVVVAIVVVLVLAAGGAVGWWLLRDDAPAEVSIDAAVAQVTTTAPAAESPTTTASGPATDAPDTTAPAPAGIEGDWAVDTSIGEFSYADSTGTFVGFRVREELAGIGEIDAVGRTPKVTGSLTIEGTTVTEVEVVADMAALTTDDSRRDGKVRGALGTDEFPTASFRLTDPIELGADAATGGRASVQANGELTIRDITLPVELPLEAQLEDGVIVVVGSLRIEFADYGVKVPTAPIVLSADEFGDVELQLFFRRG